MIDYLSIQLIQVIEMTIKDAKRNFVIDEAARLFIEKSISSVTIKDIAKASGLGEATIYRYFSGREELVVACALKLQSAVEERFFDTSATSDGYRKIEKFYNAYYETFLHEPELYRFLSEFDAYCISEGIEGLEEYADNMDRFKAAFLAAYVEGLSDGSVRPVDNIELFYYSTTHAVLSLCKKLAVEGMIRQDKLTDKTEEIRLLTDVILSFLAGK